MLWWLTSPADQSSVTTLLHCQPSSDSHWNGWHYVRWHFHTSVVDIGQCRRQHRAATQQQHHCRLRWGERPDESHAQSVPQCHTCCVPSTWRTTSWTTCASAEFKSRLALGSSASCSETTVWWTPTTPVAFLQQADAFDAEHVAVSAQLVQHFMRNTESALHTFIFQLTQCNCWSCTVDGPTMLVSPSITCWSYPSTSVADSVSVQGGRRANVRSATCTTQPWQQADISALRDCPHSMAGNVSFREKKDAHFADFWAYKAYKVCEANKSKGRCILRNADCGISITYILRKIWCGMFRKLYVVLISHSAFRIPQYCFTICKAKSRKTRSS